MGQKKVVKCEIGPYPDSLFPDDLSDLQMPEVKVEYDDGTSEVLYDFYPDEISFIEEELIGLTREEAKRLKFKKDKEYLQS